MWTWAILLPGVVPGRSTTTATRIRTASAPAPATTSTNGYSTWFAATPAYAQAIAATYPMSRPRIPITAVMNRPTTSSNAAQPPDLSIAGVAERAGVGKPAVYRRHLSKQQLVVAALDRLGDGAVPKLPDDPRAALITLLAEAARAVGSADGLTLMGSLMTQASRDPSLREAFRDAMFEPRHAVVHRVLQGAIDRGQIRSDADLDAVDAMLFGSLLARAVVGERLDASWAARVVDVAWRAIASPPDRPRRG